MKKAIVFALSLLLMAAVGFAEVGKDEKKDEKKETIQAAKCPKTQMQSECLTCHVAGKMPGSTARFPVKEAAPDAQRVYPNDLMRVLDGIAYFYLENIETKKIKEFFDYVSVHKIKRIVIEIHSPGGALFDAQRTISLIRAFQAGGGHVETRIYGSAFSAGFYVFTAGDTRLVDEYADLMWHEISSFEGYGFKISTPSDKEEAARVLRHLQDVRNNYLATRGRLTKKELDAMIAKKELWMSGKQAVEFGFADGFIK